MTRDRVDRFCLATKSGTIARVDKPQFAAIFAGCDYLAGFEDQLTIWPGHKILRCDFDRPAFDRTAKRSPAREATVQQGRPSVAEPSEQPPSPCRDCAAAVVIQHYACGRADPQSAEGASELFWVRQRVSPATGFGRGRKIHVQIGIHGTRNMSLFVVAASCQRLHKIKSAIHNAQATATNLLQ